MTAVSFMIGSSGRCYQFKKLIQERSHFSRIWLATSIPGQSQYILKDIPKAIFSNFDEIIRPHIHESRHIRLPFDQIPQQPILVYKYLTDDFHSLIKEKISIRAKKQILKDALKGLAELHSCDVVHLDIKPDNILVNCLRESGQFSIDETRIGDLENAAYLPKRNCIKGMLPGNERWRSPEGHFKGELNKPSDVFSFGIMCIYAVLGRVIFDVDDDFKNHEMQGAIPYLIHLQRQVCFFGDDEGIHGLKKHIGDDEISCQALQMLWEERNEDYLGYRSFYEWREVEDAVFRDLIQNLMSLDPARRITSVEALEHPWFEDV